LDAIANALRYLCTLAFSGLFIGSKLRCPPRFSELVAGDGDAADLVGVIQYFAEWHSFSGGRVDQAFSLRGQQYISIALPRADVGAAMASPSSAGSIPAMFRASTDCRMERRTGGIGVHLYHSNPGVGGLGALAANVMDAPAAATFASPQI